MWYRRGVGRRKIGTAEQVKVTVFGPVVNLASRLESMTKQLRVPILLDEATASLVRPKLNPEEGRLRRLATLLPYGMETPVAVSELLPPASDFPELTDAHIQSYERGVESFIAGYWDEAYRCLHAMPPSDRFAGPLAARRPNPATTRRCSRSCKAGSIRNCASNVPSGWPRCIFRAMPWAG